MPYLRRTFEKGRMNMDVDNRLLANGEYREGTNIVILNNEGNNEGVLQKALSNKRLTNLNFGPNVRTLGQFTYEARNRMYWLVLSDNGAYLCEWDENSQSATFVLQDTRPVGERVFDLKEDKLCTAIAIIATDDPDKELLLITEDNLPPLCINISRAKTYGNNGFEIDDIQLIKKPPRFGPTTQLTYANGTNNAIKEEFFTFFYRYRYLDGEYSAFSDMTEYQFASGKSQLDYITVEQLGMVNNFNAIRLGFNTGDKRVTDVQLLFKKSNSNTVYLIENFNKEDEFWGNDETRNFVFTNNKNYVALPEKELFRLYDNVPLTARSMTVIENRVFFSNYKEGYNLIDVNGRRVRPDFSIEIQSNDLGGTNLTYVLDGGEGTDEGGTMLQIDFTGVTLALGSRIRLDLVMQNIHEEGPDYITDGNFNYTFDFILNRDYTDAADLSTDAEFITFVAVMQEIFMDNYQLDPPADSTLETITPFTISDYDATTITLQAPSFIYQVDNTPSDPGDMDFTDVPYVWYIYMQSVVNFNSFAVNSSLHSNRDYEVGMLYKDSAKRSTTALTCATNTIFIPAALSVTQNKLRITVNHAPPVWADTFKFVVKHNPLSYYTIYAVLFYEQGPCIWVRLDGANKDKVKKDDILVLKSDLAGPRSDLFKVAVIDVVDQPENFISGNATESGAEIKEEAGLYMKIKAENISMDVEGAAYFYYNKSRRGAPYIDLGGIMQYVDEGTGDYVDYPVAAGTRIRIRFFCDPAISGAPTTVFEREYVSQGEYDNFEDWFDAEFGSYGESTGDFTITFSRDGDNKLIARFESEYAFIANDIRATIEITRTTLAVVFETEPTNDVPEIYYESAQSFTLTNKGYHSGNLQSQDDEGTPAIIELDFFNCYAFGDGVESYRVKDLVNKKFLNIDYKPTTTTIEPYRQMARQADICFSEPYVESAGINGLNVFNASQGNFKDDMEKRYGGVMKIMERNGNMLVFQEEKVGQVFHNKRTITTPTGEETLAALPQVLGDYAPYQGEFGVGRHPESISVDDQGRVKWASTSRGVIARLSNDGIEKITYGTKEFWRTLFREQPNAKILSGYDPYLDVTAFSIGNEPERVPEFNCGAMFAKEGQTGTFTYTFILNNLGGDVVLNYAITSGTATIVATFDGTDTVASNVDGSGTLTFERTSLVENRVIVTVTVVEGPLSYMITNLCPIGTELTIVSIVLNDSADTGLTMTDRFKRTGTGFLSTPDVFTAPPVTRFETITGTEGIGIFPVNGEVITMQAFKDTLDSGQFNIDECNRMGYLISESVYTDAEDVLADPDTEYITVTTTGEEGSSQTSSGEFMYNRTSVDQILYLIWDYTSRNPVINDVTANVNVGQTVNIDVLAGTEVGPDAVVTIGTPPVNGTATVLVDRTIDYTHNGGDVLEDTFTFIVTEGGCSSTGTISVAVGISCGSALPGGGAFGIYEVDINMGTATGWCGVQVNAQSIPDRFQLIYDGEIVSDSKYIGDGISPGPPTSYPGLLGPKTLDVYLYNGTAFVDTGVDESFTVIQDDIANNTTEPTDGNHFLVFYKENPLPSTLRLRAIGSIGATQFNLNDVLCPTEDTIEGTDKFVYGFFVEANLGDDSRSIRLWLNAANDRFYTNRFGETDFTIYAFTGLNSFVNDGTNWYQIDGDGFIIDQGAL